MTWTTVNFPDLPEQSKRRVFAYVTHRSGGVSTFPYASLNLATHVGDNRAQVMTNRAILREKLSLPSEPFWLNQTHTTQVVKCPDEYDAVGEADASYTGQERTVCTVLTADCLPILIVDQNATEVAAIHAGWRGLANGIIEQTVERLCAPATQLHVVLGPAIGPKAFEVGEDVRQAFIARNSTSTMGFQPIGKGKFLADLYGLARQILTHLGVTHISGGNYCTFSQPDLFYSYRRDGQTGRMASLIWLQDES